MIPPIEDSPQRSEAAEMRAAAQTLAVDHMTAEVLRALARVSVTPVLLKGPAVASLLYHGGALRSYHDCDLLVSPAELARAEQVLARCGFERFVQRERGFVENADGHAQPWMRVSDGANVDLHERLAFTSAADAPTGWELLSAGTRTISVGGVAVRALDEARIALLVGIHAAQHGRRPQVLEDLKRALAVFDRECWLEAARLGRALGVQSALATGLHVLPAGEQVAQELRLPRPDSIASWLTLSTAPPAAVALERMLSTPGMRAKLSFAAARVLPSAEFMRSSRPLARRGRRGLATAYALRIGDVLARLPAAVWGWLGASRLHGSPPPPALGDHLDNIPGAPGRQPTMDSSRGARHELPESDQPMIS